MSRSRSRSRSLIGVLSFALISFGFALNAQSSVATTSGQVPDYRVGGARIQGTVADQGGKLVDDVKVVAKDDDGNVVATQLTYGKADGPEHGYFNLSVVKGTYTVTLSKAGYETVRPGQVSVGRGGVAGLGKITMRKDLVQTTTVGSLADKNISVREKGKVEVTVKPGGEQPTGDVDIVEGKRNVVGSGELKASDRGAITITLARLPRGQHVLKVVYGGSKYDEGSSSKTFTLTVTKR